MSREFELSPGDVAASYGTNVAEMPPEVTAIIGRMDLGFQRLEEPRRDEVILGILKRLDDGTFSKVGEHRHDVWEKGWTENLDDFVGEGHSLESLRPRFIRPDQPVRLNKQFVLPREPAFEWHYMTAFHEWLFRRYFGGAKAIYEFGCGSGYNLAQLAKIYPSVKLVGLDWAESAVQLVNSVGSKHGLNLTGRRFDFFHPDSSICIEPGSVVTTICALEQIGDRFEEFLQFLLRQSPALCVHHEPIYELYDPTSLVDHLAMRYHAQRGYLSGFLTRLRQLEAERKIELLKVRRLQFGSLYNESYSYVVWRPLGDGSGS